MGSTKSIIHFIILTGLHSLVYSEICTQNRTILELHSERVHIGAILPKSLLPIANPKFLKYDLQHSTFPQPYRKPIIQNKGLIKFLDVNKISEKTSTFNKGAIVVFRYDEIKEVVVKSINEKNECKFGVEIVIPEGFYFSTKYEDCIPTIATIEHSAKENKNDVYEKCRQKAQKYVALYLKNEQIQTIMKQDLEKVGNYVEPPKSNAERWRPLP